MPTSKGDRGSKSKKQEGREEEASWPNDVYLMDASADVRCYRLIFLLVFCYTRVQSHLARRFYEWSSYDDVFILDRPDEARFNFRDNISDFLYSFYKVTLSDNNVSWACIILAE